MKIRVGPIGLTLNSELSVVEKNEATRTAALRVDAADKRVGGAVKSTMTMHLEPTQRHQDERRHRRPGDGPHRRFRSAVIRKKADQMLQEVANNLRKAPHRLVFIPSPFDSLRYAQDDGRYVGLFRSVSKSVRSCGVIVFGSLTM